MSDALDEAWDALDAAWDSADAPSMVKSKKKQDLARVQQEADDLLEEPSLGDKAVAFGQGLADNASMGLAPKAVGAAKALWGAAKKSPETALQAAGPALLIPGVAPMLGTAAMFGNRDEYERARDEQQGKADAVAGADEAGNVGKRGGAYAGGQLAGLLAQLGLTVGSAGARIAKEGVTAGAASKVPGAAKALTERVAGAGKQFDEAMAAGADGGVRPALTRAVSTILGRGGEAKPGMILEEAADVAADTRPEWLMSLTDEVGGAAASTADDAASGLALARPPPVPKPAPRLPRAPKPAAPATSSAPAPAAPQAAEAATRTQALEQLAAIPPEARAAAEAVTRTLPLAPPPGTPMGTQALKAAVQQGVDAGVPLKELAKSLGVRQSDIAAFFKAAQIGMLR